MCKKRKLNIKKDLNGFVDFSSKHLCVREKLKQITFIYLIDFSSRTLDIINFFD